MKIAVHAVRESRSDEVELTVLGTDGQKTYVGMIPVERAEFDDYIEPTMRIDTAAAQRLLDDLSGCGLLPAVGGDNPSSPIARTRLTQVEIAEHLDLDQSAVSRFLTQIEVDWRELTLNQIRALYIRKLRKSAAGHRTDEGDDLVHERVLTERVDRELKLYALAEKKGTLVNVDQLEPELQQMVGAFKAELLSRDDKLKATIDAQYQIDVDVALLNDYTYAALSHLARYDAGQSPVSVAPGAGVAATGADRPN